MAKRLKQFIVRKYVMAESALDAITKEKRFKVDEVWIDEKWVDTPNATGFTHEKKKD